MVRAIGARKGRQLVEDMLDAKHDLKELARKYQLQLTQLSEWGAAEDNAQTLAGLCYLADMQTQLMLSRYRLLAADRLVQLASGEDEQVTAEVSRKACVDLLRLDLKRVDGKMLQKEKDVQAVEPFDVSTSDLRALLYGDEEMEVQGWDSGKTCLVEGGA